MILITSAFLIRVLTFNRANAVALWPFVIVKRKEDSLNTRLINHERIHIRQQLELFILPFYILYLSEYIYHRIKGNDHLQSYLHISFEKEAYQNDNNKDYLLGRPWWAWRGYY